MGLLTGDNIANVERIKITTEETEPKTYVFQTATSCKYTASLSEGSEVVQRIKNTVMGLIKTDDLVKGYDIELTDERIIMEIMALVDGGNITMGSGESANQWESYASPVAGQGVTRTPFTMTLYTSDRGTDGSANKYYAWAFAGCKGKPVSGSAEDGAFSKMTYNIESRPANGTSALTVTRVDELPAVS